MTAKKTNFYRVSKSLVGKEVEIAYECRKPLKPFKGSKAKVLKSEGEDFLVEVEGEKLEAKSRDLYIKRKMVEDFTPRPRNYELLKDNLEHWKVQREYLLESNSGLESICFALASTSESFSCAYEDESFIFYLPTATVAFPVIRRGQSWYTSAIIMPPDERVTKTVSDHWDRVFMMGVESSIRESWTRDFYARMVATKEVLAPMAKSLMPRIMEAYHYLGGTGDPPKYSIGFSKVRVLPNKIGINEPPGGHRDYSVISVSPEAAKDESYLEQVVLHECIHAVVGKIGGKPHNYLFQNIAKMVGLETEHRD